MKKNEEINILNSLDNKAKYLIFKMTIDTKQNYPITQLLLKFRKINNIVFEIYTTSIISIIY